MQQLSRLVSKKDMKVLVNGKYARQIGNVCMDQMMIDVSGIDVKEGDTVTLIGQDGDNYLSVNQISLLSNTITNETLSVIGEREYIIYKIDNKLNIEIKMPKYKIFVFRHFYLLRDRKVLHKIACLII